MNRSRLVLAAVAVVTSCSGGAHDRVATTATTAATTTAVPAASLQEVDWDHVPLPGGKRRVDDVVYGDLDFDGTDESAVAAGDDVYVFRLAAGAPALVTDYRSVDADARHAQLEVSIGAAGDEGRDALVVRRPGPRSTMQERTFLLDGDRLVAVGERSSWPLVTVTPDLGTTTLPEGERVEVRGDPGADGPFRLQFSAEAGERVVLTLAGTPSDAAVDVVVEDGAATTIGAVGPQAGVLGTDLVLATSGTCSIVITPVASAVSRDFDLDVRFSPEGG